MSTATKPELHHYLKAEGYRIASLEEIFTGGATQCRYFSLLLEDGSKRFIKVGEKVDYELNNLNYLSEIHFSESPRVLIGSSLERKILITNWATYPKLGHNLVRALNNGTASVDDVLKMQKAAFSFLKKLYSFSPDKKVLPYPQSSHERISVSLALLQNMKGSLAIDDCEINLSQIIDIPISITNVNSSAYPISIREMCLNLNNLVLKSDQMSAKRIIHADFHPPNIVGDKDGIIRVIDFSDMAYSDNPCWDLGKWLNYMKRFHRVAELRQSGKKDEKIIVRKDANSLIFEDAAHPLVALTPVEEDARRLFQDIIELSEIEISIQGLLSEFIVNMYTLNRHYTFYPHTVKNILMYIRGSYQVVIDNI